MGMGQSTPALPACREALLQQACNDRTAHHPRYRLSPQVRMLNLLRLCLPQILGPEPQVSTCICRGVIELFGASELAHLLRVLDDDGQTSCSQADPRTDS